MIPNQPRLDGMIRPTLYLGLGGTGKEILLRLRRRLYERFGRSSLPFTSFLWADLDARDVGAQGEELNEVLNRVRFEAHERVALLDGNIGKDFGNILRDEVQFRQIHQWLYPEVQRYGSGVEDGAGGVRAIGRLAWFKHFSGAIATRIPVALQSIASQGSINDTKAVFESRSLGAPRFDPTPQVVIVCSLAGGTGGGTIVDTLFYLKRLQEMGTLIGGVIPVILLPNVYYEDPLQDWRSKRSYGNAYAALKELEFYSAGVPEGMTQSPDFRVEWQANHKSAIPGPPFSAAYLIETQNEAGVSIPPDDRKELFDSVAASLFLDLMPGEFSDAKRVSHANVAGFMEEAAANTAPAGEKGAVRQEFAKRYGSFGAARVEIPVGTLLRACAARLSEQMCLHLRRSKPMDWLAEVRRDMADRGLDRSGLDKRLGLVWRDSLDREVARIFARPIHNEYDLLALEKDLATASVDLLESRRGTVPAAIKATLSAAKEQVGRDIEEWVLECLNAEERGPKPLVTEQGLIDRFEEEWSRLDAGTDGRAGDLALAAKQADGDAGIWRARCTQIEEELRTAISSFGLTVFAAREGVVEALREQYGEAQKQQWLARADKYRLDATGEFLAAGRERLKSWRSRIKTFLDRLGPWAGGFAEMQLEMLTSPDDNFSIRLHKPGDFETYYRLDNKIVDHGSELVSYLHSLTPQKPTAAGLMALSEGSGEGAAAAHLYAWTEERFHRDAEVNPRPLDMFSYPRLQASQQTREIAERIVKAAQPMLRHQSAPDAQAAQNARECYLGLPDPNDPRCFALRDAIVNQLLSLNYTNPQVLSMGDPSQIFLYTVDYGCTLPMVNLAANECYEAYSAFYSERIANRLQGQPENQIPLHISQEWEDQFPDLIAHSGVEAEKIAAVRRLLLFGVMLNVLDREQGRFSPHYTYLRGRPHFAAEELGNFRDTVELLRTRDDLYNKIHDAVDSRERGLDAEANRALYFACQYLVQSGNLQPSMPEFTYLQRKLTELGGALKVGQASAGQDLQPKGATPKERAAYSLAAAGEALTLKENLPIMVKLEPYSFSDMPSDVCANCKSLVVLDEDHRCSRCGAEFSRFEISLNRYHVEPGDTRAIRLFVANQSSVEMHVRRIDCDRPWLYVPSEPVSVEAGRTKPKVIDLTADTTGLNEDSARITVETNFGSRSLNLLVSPAPAGELLVKEKKVALFGVDGERSIPFEFRLTSGRGRLLGFELTPNLGKIVTERQLPIDLEPGLDPIIGAAVISVPLVAQQPGDASRTLPVCIAAKLDVGAAKLEARFEIEHHSKSPDWHMEFFDDPVKVISGEPIAIRGRLRVSGEFAGYPTGARVWLKETPLDPISCLIDSSAPARPTAKLILPGLPAGRHFLEIEVVTNPPSNSRRWAQVDVKPITENLEAILAVDFGSSNTCFAIMQPRREPQAITVADSQDVLQDVIPTALVYYDARPSQQPIYKFGRGAWDGTSEVTPKLARSLARNLKQNLGEIGDLARVYYEDPPREVPDANGLSASTEYLRQLKISIERHHLSRYVRIVATHPAIFGVRQTRHLRTAIQDAFEPQELRFIQEPIAAAITVVFERELYKREEPFYVGVYDFGGGTTDLSIIRFENKQEKFGCNVVPQVLRSFGKWFGGEDLTDFLEREISGKIARYMESNGKQGRYLNDPAEGDKQIVETNKLRVRKRAEDQKIAWSTGRQISTTGAIHVQVEIQGQIVEEEIPDEVLLSGANGGPALVEVFEQHLARQVRELGTQLAEARGKIAGCDGLHYLVLSGKSSEIPLVRKVLEEIFPLPETEIVSPLDTKKCVVQGACYFAERGTTVAIEVPQGRNATLQTTTSRLGLVLAAGRHQEFHEILGFGEALGEEGVEDRTKMPIRWQYGMTIEIFENLGFIDRWEGRDMPPEVQFLAKFKPVEHPNVPMVVVVLQLGSDLGLTCRLESEQGDVFPTADVSGQLAGGAAA